MITPLKYKPEATEDDILESWRDVKNNLFFTKGYTDIFKDNMIDGLWIAYTSFTKIFEKYPGPDFLAPYMQVFTYKRKKFWIMRIDCVLKNGANFERKLYFSMAEKIALENNKMKKIILPT